MDIINDLFLESLRELSHRVMNFIPNILVMFLIVIAGVALSAVARFLMLRVFGLIKFDGMAERVGVPHILAKGGIIGTPSRMVSSVLYWGILSVFIMMGFIALDIAPINNLISDFLSYLPSMIAAVLILILGMMLGNFVERSVLVAVGEADISRADLIGKVAKVLIVVMTAAMALEQLGIARGIIIAAFSISFGGIVFAVSLAFGLGAQDIAREFMHKRLRKGQEKKDEHL